MSSQPVSLLNAHSNTNGQRCCRSETFNLKDIEMIVEKKDQPWSKRACVGKLLGLTDIIKSTASLGQDDQQTRASSEAKPTRHMDWSEPKDRQNKTDRLVFFFVRQKIYFTIKIT